MLRAGADEQLQAALNAWRVGLCEWRHSDGYVTGSVRFFELYGWAGPDPMPCDAFWSAIYAADRAEVRAAFERALAGEGHIDITHRVVHPGGNLVWLQLRAQTRFETLGALRRPLATSGSVMDVSDRKHVEQELRHTEARFDEALRSAQFGIFEHNHLEDPRAENVYWSPRLREIFGVSADEPGSARTLIAHVPEEDLEMMHAAVARAHDPRGDGFYDVEHRYIHPTQGVRWLLTRSSTHFGDVDGRRVPVRTVGAMIDITARRKIEEEHEQRARILDATSDLVGITEPDGAFVYLNRAAREFLGIAADAALSHAAPVAHPPDALRRFWAECVPAAARDGAWKGELEFRRRDGCSVPMSLVLLAHRGHAGQALWFSMIARDLSRERQLEENMRQSQKMEAVGRLAGGIAHDFNNILSAILSFAHVAAGEVGETRRGYAEIQEIIVAGKRAAALTQQLLAFSRKQVLRPQIVDAGEVLTRMAPLLRRLVGEHIDFALSLDSRPLRIRVDPTNLEQVLLNLAINARDAMEDGGRLSIECRPVSLQGAAAARIGLEPGRYVVISVLDTGVGMDAETKAHAFEPFFTTKGATCGTGLGLATVFGIVKQSGGSVCIESELGRGSTFEAYFPSSDEPVTVRRDPPKVELVTRGGVVLVAEDDAAVRRVIGSLLRRAGYTVLEAPGPHEALELASAHRAPVDLLLTDVVLPQQSGTALAERMLELNPRLLVIYMSGYTHQDIAQRGVLDGAARFLAKPITPERLLEAVAGALGEAQGGSALARGVRIH